MPNTPDQIGNNPERSPEDAGPDQSAKHAAERAGQDAKRDNLARRIADGASGARPHPIGGR